VLLQGERNRQVPLENKISIDQMSWHISRYEIKHNVMNKYPHTDRYSSGAPLIPAQAQK
jgi:hypothetical protein